MIWLNKLYAEYNSLQQHISNIEADVESDDSDDEVEQQRVITPTVPIWMNQVQQQKIIEIEDDDATPRISNRGRNEIRNLTDRLNTGQVNINNNLRTRLQTRTAEQINNNNNSPVHNNNDQAHIVMPTDECFYGSLREYKMIQSYTKKYTVYQIVLMKHGIIRIQYKAKCRVQISQKNLIKCQQ